jgi:hypothetical protein
MNDTRSSSSDLSVVIEQVREHLLQAQQLVDGVAPDSVVGARLQHLLDDLERQITADIRRSSGETRLD